MSDPVVIAPYDTHWPQVYEEEKRLILEAVGPWVAAIEHVGSTSVPGLSAKPIIDIMVGLRRLDDAANCIEPLSKLGWVYKPEAEAEMPLRRYFNKGPQSNHRHLHMVEVGSEFWAEILLFRDYLRAHPAMARQYQALKLSLAERFQTDREGYTEAKTEFIRGVVAKARSGEGVAPATPAKRRRQKTETSDFGTAGRINHDATRFYSSRLYEGMPVEDTTGGVEVALPGEARDHIFCVSSEHMTQLPDNCVHLMVTSPPYNVGKQYDEDMTLDEYRAFLKRVWAEVKRVLAPGGRACINVANLGRKPYIPLHAFIVEDMISLGYLMRGEIIWNKAGGGSPSTAWGSWRSAANPTLRDAHEYICVFSKGSFGRSGKDRESTLGRDEFLELTKSVWTFPAEPARKVGHPAPFPLELPRRLIQLYTFAGDVVLDPFMGSGQTAIAARALGRAYIGYDTEPEYVALAEKRIGRAQRGLIEVRLPGIPS